MRKYIAEAFTDKVQKFMRVVCQTGSVNTKAERVPISLFGLTCNTDVKLF